MLIILFSRVNYSPKIGNIMVVPFICSLISSSKLKTDPEKLNHLMNFNLMFFQSIGYQVLWNWRVNFYNWLRRGNTQLIGNVLWRQIERIMPVLSWASPGLGDLIFSLEKSDLFAIVHLNRLLTSQPQCINEVILGCLLKPPTRTSFGELTFSVRLVNSLEWCDGEIGIILFTRCTWKSAWCRKKWLLNSCLFSILMDQLMKLPHNVALVSVTHQIEVNTK